MSSRKVVKKHQHVLMLRKGGSHYRSCIVTNCGYAEYRPLNAGKNATWKNISQGRRESAIVIETVSLWDSVEGQTHESR